MKVKNIQGITHGWLRSGGGFEWHKHDDCNEFMYVLKESGIVRDEDGEYSFAVGDFFIFPKGTFHEQRNTSEQSKYNKFKKSPQIANAESGARFRLATRRSDQTIERNFLSDTAKISKSAGHDARA